MTEGNLLFGMCRVFADISTKLHTLQMNANPHTRKHTHKDSVTVIYNMFYVLECLQAQAYTYTHTYTH